MTDNIVLEVMECSGSNNEDSKEEKDTDKPEGHEALSTLAGQLINFALFGNTVSDIMRVTRIDEEDGKFERDTIAKITLLSLSLICQLLLMVFAVWRYIYIRNMKARKQEENARKQQRKQEENARKQQRKQGENARNQQNSAKNQQNDNREFGCCKKKCRRCCGCKDTGDVLFAVCLILTTAVTGLQIVGGFLSGKDQCEQATNGINTNSTVSGQLKIHF